MQEGEKNTREVERREKETERKKERKKERKREREREREMRRACEKKGKYNFSHQPGQKYSKHFQCSAYETKNLNQ